MKPVAFDVISPIDGSLIKTYPETELESIGDKFQLARHATREWADQDVNQRLQRIWPLTEILLENIDDISGKLVQLTGKVKTEVLFSEIYPILEMLRYYRKNAAKILAPCAVTTPALTFPATSARYYYQPLGVVAVISPWNYPFQLTLYPLLTALIAGNAVIFKPSELSLPVAEWIMDLLDQLDLPHGLVQWIAGGAETGSLLIEQKPDLVFFTGGLQAGRSVMQAAAQHPIPVLLELGGKDAMLVFADANLNRAVKAAVYGAFTNSGQLCVSIEKLYVETTIYEEFINRLCEQLCEIKIGHGKHGDIGAMTSPLQIERIKKQFQDAVDKGASVSGPLQLEGNFVRPVLLWDVSDEMLIQREESFGPLLCVIPFKSQSSVIDSLNDSPFGLNASVWSNDVDKAVRVAEQLEVGNWVVNDVVKNIGQPGLPFGGVKQSGFGRYHGAEGLRSLSRTVSGVVSYSRLAKEPNWFPYTLQGYALMSSFFKTVFSVRPLYQRLWKNRRELLALRQYSALNLRQHWRNGLIFLFGKQY